MTLPIFVPPMMPDDDAMLTMQPRIIATAFGDGYAHRVADGPNFMQEQWTLNWSLLTPDVANDIYGFFVNQQGYLPFLWTAPGNSVAKTYLCAKWTRQIVDGQNQKITTQFTEIADFSTS